MFTYFTSSAKISFYILGQGNQRGLRNVLVDEVNLDRVCGLALGVGVDRAKPEPNLQVIIRDLEISFNGVLLPVKLHSCCGLRSCFSCGSRRQNSSGTEEIGIYMPILSFNQ